MTNKIWMRVSNDKYQLPEFVCDSVRDLCEKYGVSEGTIRAEISKFKNGKRLTTRYMFVDLTDDHD